MAARAVVKVSQEQRVWPLQLLINSNYEHFTVIVAATGSLQVQVPESVLAVCADNETHFKSVQP